jgi:tRNA A-37 threonylcarbamoyl transferase component Bud32
MLTTSDCPNLAVLERLLLGQIAQSDAETLESHVLDCPVCAQKLQKLNVDDGLVSAMREARTQAMSPSSEAANALIPWLKRLRPKDATQTMSLFGSGADTPPLATVLPTYDFLTPPEQTDELGRLMHYRVLQTIGVGGMGMVFLAEDTHLQRQVALKVIKPELLERRDLHERFLTEARAIAAVEHDNIVVIYEAGDAGGVPYLVMPLLHGESLEDRLRDKDGPLPVDDILRIGREIASGLEAAHQRGLVHRDIKPSNLWLEQKDNKDKTQLPLDRSATSSFRVKILDFGLARTAEGLNEEGQNRTILGTPAYMSPEQGRGQIADARSDLFSLGCVLYRMATGRLPFQGKDIVTTLLSVATDSPVSAKKLNPKLPTELVTLIEKLLSKKADDRYASAQEVVAAIQTIERKRQPRAIGRWLLAMAACIIVVGLGTFGLLSYLHRPAPPVEVTLEYDEADTVLVLQRDEDPEQEIDVKQTPRPMLKPGTYVIRPKKESSERELWPNNFVVEANKPMVVPLRLVGLIRSYGGYRQPITSVAVLPRKDAFLALTGSKDRDLRLWDLQTDGAGIGIEGHQSPVHCLAVSPDGKQALTGSGIRLPRQPDTFVRVWDLDTRNCLAERVGHDSSVTAVAWDPKGKMLLSADMDGVIIFWDAQTLKRVATVEEHERSAVYGLAFLPDGKRFLSCGSDAKLFLWDVEKRVVVKKLAGHTDTITAVSASPDGKHAATSSKDGTIRVWNLQTGDSIVLKGHEKDVDCIAYSPDGKRLLSGGRDATLRLWNAETGEWIRTFLRHKNTVHGCAFSTDGRRAVSGGADRLLCLWELPK